jgi:uncharacterized membrane protein YphA (DoxX/SURF4 family)
MLAGIFVSSGADAFLHPEAKVPRAEAVAPVIAERLGLPPDTERLVRLNGAVMVAGGALLATGRLPRLAALAVLGALVPTTVAGHAFWSETDPAAKQQQRIQFLKNLAMGGGLLLAATDTDGRPSLGWRARRAARRGLEAIPTPG